MTHCVNCRQCAGASAADGLEVSGTSGSDLHGGDGAGGHAAHARGDEAFMDHRAAAALDMHRVSSTPNLQILMPIP